MAVSFDLFGTLLEVDRPPDPAAAIAAELRRRDVRVPHDWTSAYREPHLDVPDGAEVPLSRHVSAVLRDRGLEPPEETIRRAVLAAFDPDVRTLPGARNAVRAAAERGPVGICSNCSVAGLVPRALSRSRLDPDAFDAIVTSVECGWRKPDSRAFEAIAERLGVALEGLVHVGDDRRTDGGVADAGGQAMFVTGETLWNVPDRLESLEEST